MDPRGPTRRQVATETETAFETETEPVEVEDFYELLGVSEEADVKEIKAAFRALVRWVLGGVGGWDGVDAGIWSSEGFARVWLE